LLLPFHHFSRLSFPNGAPKFSLAFLALIILISISYNFLLLFWLSLISFPSPNFSLIGLLKMILEEELLRPRWKLMVESPTIQEAPQIMNTALIFFYFCSNLFYCLMEERKTFMHAGIHYQLKSGLIRVFGIDIIYRDPNFLRRVGVCIAQIVILFSADLGLLFIGLFRNQQQPCRD
jgi:hypothetical protein